MHFFIFYRRDVTPHRTTDGIRRARADQGAMVTIALKGGEGRADVFATVSTPILRPSLPSSPRRPCWGTSRRDYRPCCCPRPPSLSHTTYPYPREDLRELRDLRSGLTAGSTLMLGRGNTGSVYHWFGQDNPHGRPLAHREIRLLQPAVACEDGVDWTAAVSVPSLRRSPPLPRRLEGIPPFVWQRIDPQQRIARAGFILDGERLFFANHIFCPRAHPADGGPGTPLASPTWPSSPDLCHRWPGRASFHAAHSQTRLPSSAVLRPRRVRARPVAGWSSQATAVDRGTHSSLDRTLSFPGTSATTTASAVSGRTMPSCG